MLQIQDTDEERDQDGVQGEAEVGHRVLRGIHKESQW